METGKTEATPDLDDLLQEEHEQLAVPVTVEGFAMVHDLPSRRVIAGTDVAPVLAWTPLLPATPKRKRAVVISLDAPFYVSTKGTGSTGMKWPANVPMEIRHTQAVQVMSAHATDPATISHYSEMWAD